MNIKEQISAYATEGLDPKSGIKNPDRKHNGGTRLYDIYFWQELSALADARLKEAWASAAEQGLVKSDDHYRNAGPGESIAAESPSFSVLMKVSSPRKTLDKEALLDTLSKKLRIARPAVEDLLEQHMKEGKASLSKKVLEV